MTSHIYLTMYLDESTDHIDPKQIFSIPPKKRPWRQNTMPMTHYTSAARDVKSESDQIMSPIPAAASFSYPTSSSVPSTASSTHIIKENPTTAPHPSYIKGNNTYIGESGSRSWMPTTSLKQQQQDRETNIISTSQTRRSSTNIHFINSGEKHTNKYQLETTHSVNKKELKLGPPNRQLSDFISIEQGKQKELDRLPCVDTTEIIDTTLPKMSFNNGFNSTSKQEKFSDGDLFLSEMDNNNHQFDSNVNSRCGSPLGGAEENDMEMNKLLAQTTCSKERRKIKNRFAARKTRMKKMEKTDGLEKRNSELQTENDRVNDENRRLRNVIASLEHSIKTHGYKCQTPNYKSDFPSVYTRSNYTPTAPPTRQPLPQRVQQHQPQQQHQPAQQQSYQYYNPQQYYPTPPHSNSNINNTGSPPFKKPKMERKMKQIPRPLNINAISNTNSANCNNSPPPPPRRSPRIAKQGGTAINRMDTFDYKPGEAAPGAIPNHVTHEAHSAPHSANTNRAFDLCSLLKGSGVLDNIPTPTIKAECLDSPAGNTRSRSFNLPPNNF